MSTSKDKDVKNMTVADSLKKIRKQYKLTQEDVAKFLGISRSGYTYYETGKSLPSIDVLKKLAAMYDTSIDNVVGNTVKNADPRYAKSNLAMEDCSDPLMYMKKDEQEVVMAYRLLDDEEKDKLRQYTMELLSEKSEQ